MQQVSESNLREAARLSCLAGYPFLIEGQLELARALEEVCGDSTRYAEKLVSAIVDDGGRCPDPRQIKRRGWELAHPASQARHQCTKCGGTGWESFEKRVWHETEHGPIAAMQSFARRCRVCGVGTTASAEESDAA